MLIDSLLLPAPFYTIPQRIRITRITLELLNTPVADAGVLKASDRRFISQDSPSITRRDHSKAERTVAAAVSKKRKKVQA
jgi:hypothetical protein